MVVPVLHDAHVGLHDRDAGLHQPPRQQQRLAEGVPAVAVAHGRRLAVHLEGVGDLYFVASQMAGQAQASAE